MCQRGNCGASLPAGLGRDWDPREWRGSRGAGCRSSAAMGPQPGAAVWRCLSKLRVQIPFITPCRYTGLRGCRAGGTALLRDGAVPVSRAGRDGLPLFPLK